MPLFDFFCPVCGKGFEELVPAGRQECPPCPACGNVATRRQLPAVSSLTGRERAAVPDAGGHGCCGSRPSERGCRPGSCCGKA
jgi:putative FmdB family regulatory protein